MRLTAYLLIASLCACGDSESDAVRRGRELQKVNAKFWVSVHRELLDEIRLVYKDHLRITEDRLPRTLTTETRIDANWEETCDEFLMRITPLAERLNDTSLVGDWQLISDVMKIMDCLEFVYRELKAGIKSGRFDGRLDERRKDLITRGRVFKRIDELLGR